MNIKVVVAVDGFERTLTKSGLVDFMANNKELMHSVLSSVEKLEQEKKDADEREARRKELENKPKKRGPGRPHKQ